METFKRIGREALEKGGLISHWQGNRLYIRKKLFKIFEVKKVGHIGCISLENWAKVETHWVLKEAPGRLHSKRKINNEKAKPEVRSFGFRCGRIPLRITAQTVDPEGEGETSCIVVGRIEWF